MKRDETGKTFTALEEIVWETAEDSDPPEEKINKRNKQKIFEIFLVMLQPHSLPYWNKRGNVRTKRSI
jgi:hypothetical protein